MAGDTGVRVAEPCVLVGIADGAADQSDWGDGSSVAGGAAVVDLRVVGVGTEGRTVTVGDAGGGAATDKTAVVDNMVGRLVGMAVNTG